MARKNQQPRRGGRRKLYSDRILLPLAPGILQAVDKILSEGESRLDFIRGAINLELLRRHKHRPR
jgi:hypothetical protein